MKRLSLIIVALLLALAMLATPALARQVTKNATGTGSDIPNLAVVVFPADRLNFSRCLAYELETDLWSSPYKAYVYARGLADVKSKSTSPHASGALIPIDTAVAAYHFAAEDYVVVQNAAGTYADFRMVSSVSFTHVTLKNALSSGLQGTQTWIYEMTQLGSISLTQGTTKHTASGSSATGLWTTPVKDSPMAIFVHAASAASINYATGDWL